ncbi:MAG: EthD family reductase [Actinobacteria bacterium]|nr:EthD family reductase [Actinomycetota bacterium]
MFTVHIWLRRKEGTSPEEFRDYWLTNHAPIARDGYPNLRGYRVSVVTGAGREQEVPYDGVAELSWDSREDFSADMKTEAARRGTEDLAGFTSAFGLLFVEQETVA